MFWGIGVRAATCGFGGAMNLYHHLSDLSHFSEVVHFRFLNWERPSGTAWAPLPVTWPGDILQAVSWGNCRAHLLSFPCSGFIMPLCPYPLFLSELTPHPGGSHSAEHSFAWGQILLLLASLLRCRWMGKGFIRRALVWCDKCKHLLLEVGQCPSSACISSI